MKRLKKNIIKIRKELRESPPIIQQAIWTMMTIFLMILTVDIIFLIGIFFL